MAQPRLEHLENEISLLHVPEWLACILSSVLGLFYQFFCHTTVLRLVWAAAVKC